MIKLVFKLHIQIIALDIIFRTDYYGIMY